MDELINYVNRPQRPKKLGAQLYNFLHNLSEEARAGKNLVLCVSIPGSELEMTAEDPGTTSRSRSCSTGSARRSSCRPRPTMPRSSAAGSSTGPAYPRKARRPPRPTPTGSRTTSRWSATSTPTPPGTVPGDPIRSTRRCSRSSSGSGRASPDSRRPAAMLRLLALWVSHAYKRGYKGVHRDPLIGLGTAPLDDPYFRAALFEQLGNNDLEGPVTTDIAGKKEAHALRLDRDADDAVKKARLHQKVATTILFESNGGMTRAEATVPEIRLAVAEPDLDIANVESALEALDESCYYLRADHNRYRFSMSPNLNKLLTDRRSGVSTRDIDERVKQVVQEAFKTGPGAGMGTVPRQERAGLRPPGADAGGDVSRPGPRRPRHAQADRPDRPRAWPVRADVQERPALRGRRERRSPTRRGPQAARLGRYPGRRRDGQAARRRSAAAARTGRQESGPRPQGGGLAGVQVPFTPGTDNTLQEIDLGLVNSSAAGSLAELYVNRLRERDEITDSVGPNKLIKAWPPANKEWTTKAVRDAFFSSPTLPRLLKPDAIKRTIADGVNQKLIAYAGKTASGQYDPFIFEPDTGVDENDIEISDEMVILRAKDADDPQRACPADAH